MSENEPQLPFIRLASELRMHQLLGQVPVSDGIRDSLEARFLGQSGIELSPDSLIHKLDNTISDVLEARGIANTDQVLLARMPSVIKAVVAKRDRSNVLEFWQTSEQREAHASSNR